MKCTGAGKYNYSEYMGETWSDPIITRIRVEVGGDDNDGAGWDRWVAIFAAGYSEKSDPNVAPSYDGTSTASTTREGRAVFVIDLQTGDLIAMRRYSHDGVGGDARMKYSFSATPAVFDLDFDGYADVVYFADLGGNLWKWVIADLAELPASGVITNDATLEQKRWEWGHLFEAEYCKFDSSTSPPICDGNHYRSLYYPPTGSLIQGTLWLAFGSGERNQLDYPGDPNTPNENNRFYVMKDLDPFEKLAMTSTFGARYTDRLGSTDFVPIGNRNDCGYPEDPEVGYYLEAADGEKFITNSVIFFGNVFTLSFIPDSKKDPCTAGGKSYLYGFDLQCGEGAFKKNVADPKDRTRVFNVGGGVPNRPRVSVGPVKSPPPCKGPGCQPPDCKNMVVVITSDGTAYSDSPNTDCPSGIRINSWRDF